MIQNLETSPVSHFLCYIFFFLTAPLSLIEYPLYQVLIRSLCLLCVCVCACLWTIFGSNTSFFTILIHLKKKPKAGHHCQIDEKKIGDLDCQGGYLLTTPSQDEEACKSFSLFFVSFLFSCPPPPPSPRFWFKFRNICMKKKLQKKRGGDNLI